LRQLQRQLLKATFTIFLLLVTCYGFAQADSALKVTTNTQKQPYHAATAIGDTAKGNATVPQAGVDSAAFKNAGDSSKPLASDSVAALKPTGNVVTAPPAWPNDTVFARFFTFTHAEPGKQLLINQGDERQPVGKELLFYIMAGLVLFVGIIKVAYPKYFQDVFRLFIQTSQRQKQTPEQIVQGYVPGFLFNVLFLMVGGMLITLYAVDYKYLTGPLWLLGLYCAGVLGGIYLVKYTITAFAGWVFNVKEAAGMYSFIVFLINRVIGIVLLPLLILICFYGGDTNTVLFTVALSIVFLLLVYRYALSLTVIRKNLKVSALHFFIYLCAVELMPLLVIYKELFNQVHRK
jgi:Domain of unknown function (DUF4271)